MAAGHALALCVLAAAAYAPPSLRFYMYTERELDFSWLARCDGYEQLKNSANAEGMQEANLFDALVSHPYRTANASEAALFYIPVWEYASFRLGECEGVSHERRMVRAHKALKASVHFQRRLGRDHFWASSKTMEHTNAKDDKGRITGYTDKYAAGGAGMHWRRVDMRQRLIPFNRVLGETSVGRPKPYGRHPADESMRESSVVGRCTFDMGHQPNQEALRAFPPDDSRRPLLLYFAGGLDVCCTGQRIRCEVGQLLLGRAPDVRIEIGLREAAIRRFGGAASVPPCTAKALDALAAERAISVPALVDELRSTSLDDPNASKYTRMGRTMARSVFCLCPAGDICTSSRFVSAIAAGCIPVVLCDELYGPYSHKEGPWLRPVPYEDFWVKFPTGAFLRRPASVVEHLRAMSADEVGRRQAALRRYRAQILLQPVGGHAAATHFLEEVADCVHLNRGRPYSPQIISEFTGKYVSVPGEPDVSSAAWRDKVTRLAEASAAAGVLTPAQRARARRGAAVGAAAAAAATPRAAAAAAERVGSGPAERSPGAAESVSAPVRAAVPGARRDAPTAGARASTGAEGIEPTERAPEAGRERAPPAPQAERSTAPAGAGAEPPPAPPEAPLGRYELATVLVELGVVWGLYEWLVRRAGLRAH